MRYGNDTSLDEEKADDFLNKMIIAEKVAERIDYFRSHSDSCQFFAFPAVLVSHCFGF